MARLSEIMLQAQLEATDPNKAQDWSQPFRQGVQLAQQAQQVQMEREQLEMKKQQAQELKLQKFAEAVEAGQKYAGKAQSNYYNKFLPQYKNALGLQDMISDDALGFAMATPENQAKFHSLIADVREGRMTAQDAIAVASDPVKFADVTPTMLSQIGEAQKTYLGNAAQMARTQYTAQAASQRAREEDLRAGQVQVARDTGKEFAAWEGGGKARAEKNIGLLEDAVKKLSKNPDLSGGITSKIPGLRSDVLQEELNPEGIAVRDQVRNAIQTTLRETLGAQFTQQEGEAIFNRAFNPRLSAAENAKRAAIEVKALKQMVKDREALFRKQGFSKGNTAPGPQSSRTEMGGGEQPQAPAPDWNGKQISLEKVGQLLQTNPELAPQIAQKLGYTEQELRRLVAPRGK